MNLKSRLYFSPLFYIIHYLCVIRKMVGGIFMVYGYYDKFHKKFLKRCRIASTAVITDKKNLQIGDNVWINHYVRIDAAGGVIIDEGCQIGYGSCILSHSTHNSIRLMGYHFMDYQAQQRAGYIAKQTRIGRYSFIGGGSFIMPGITIGKGCVIGVNSVVTHDLPDYSIAVGSPAKIIGNTKQSDLKFKDNPMVNKFYYNK